jgi:hypothetical protein
MRQHLSHVGVVFAVVFAGCGQPTSELDAALRADAGAAHDAASSSDAGLDAAADHDAAADGDASNDGDAAVDHDASNDSGQGAIINDAGSLADTGTDAATSSDATTTGPRVFDVRILADSACSELSFDPPSIRVPEGTSFTVRWINATGCTDVDVDKNGDVSIVIGLPPGASYHDTVRAWCGTLFTGTFYFRAYYAPSSPYYLDVDCSG